MSFSNIFVRSLLPGNYALTKSMELTRIGNSGTLWYVKKFLTLYYYVFLSDKLMTREYVTEAAADLDRYIEGLDEALRPAAEAYFYPADDPAINLKSPEFIRFSSFAGYNEFASEEERAVYLQRAKKCYFSLLMGSGGQKGVKKKLKEAIRQPGFVYSAQSIDEAIFSAALEVCEEEANQEHTIRDNSVKYILSAEAIKRICDASFRAPLAMEDVRRIVGRFPERAPNYRGIERDFVAFIRNERQILYYYGYCHSKSSGAKDFEFSSLTPVGELALHANAEEFLAIWEHQKIKMISQPVVEEINNVPAAAASAERFAVSYTPYTDILGHLLRRGKMSREEYQYLVSRRRHTVSQEDWIAAEDELCQNLDAVKKAVAAFGRRRDVTTEDSRKELDKYLLGIRSDLPADAGRNPLNACRLSRARAEVVEPDTLRLLCELYSKLDMYKTARYGEIFAESEAELRRRYAAARAGRKSEAVDPRVRIRWELYNIHADRLILLCASLAIAARRAGVSELGELKGERLSEVCAAMLKSFRSLLRGIGISSAAKLKKELRAALGALETEDFSAFFPAAEDEREEVLAKYREIGTEDLRKKIKALSAAANVSPMDGRVRNATLIGMLRSYYIRRYTDARHALRCECCGEEAFVTEHGEPYLEFHHLIPFNLAHGPDHYLNLFALCPNCHRKMHFGDTAKKAVQYRLLSRNNYLRMDLVERLKALRRQGLLRSYHLSYLLADRAITEEEYDLIATQGSARMLNEAELKNRIFQAYSDEKLREFPADSVDLVVTSPPYDDLRDYGGKGLWNFDVFQKIAGELLRVVKPGGVVVWVVGDKTEDGNKSLSSFRQALYFQQIGFQMFDVLIYEKAGSGPPHPNRYFNAFEYMFVFSKGKPKTVHILKDKPNRWAGVSTYGSVTRREKDGSLTDKGRKTVNDLGVRTNVWKYVNGKGFSTKDEIAYRHPAIFPEKLAEDHILSWSDPGDLVLDPFGGSGTTAKMAKLHKRNWVLIEAVGEYCEIARERVEGVADESSDNKSSHPKND